MCRTGEHERWHLVQGVLGRGAGAEGWGAAGDSVAGRGREGPGDRRKRLFPEISQRISSQASTGVRALKKLAPFSRAFPPPENLQRSRGLCPPEVTSVLTAPGRDSPGIWGTPWGWLRSRRPGGRIVCPSVTRCRGLSLPRSRSRRCRVTFITLWLQFSRGRPGGVGAEGALPERVGCRELLWDQKSEL